MVKAIVTSSDGREFEIPNGPDGVPVGIPEKGDIIVFQGNHYLVYKKNWFINANNLVIMIYVDERYPSGRNAQE